MGAWHLCFSALLPPHGLHPQADRLHVVAEWWPAPPALRFFLTKNRIPLSNHSKKGSDCVMCPSQNPPLSQGCSGGDASTMEPDGASSTQTPGLGRGEEAFPQTELTCCCQDREGGTLDRTRPVPTPTLLGLQREFGKTA